MRVKRTISWLVGSALLMVTAVSAAAQSRCPVEVQEAVEAAQAACGDLNRNEACYGNNQVGALSWEGGEVPDFDEPGSKVSILDVASLVTYPFNPDTNTWGVALMAVQADLPNTLPGQNVTLVLFGDVQVESDVPPEQIAIPEPLPARIINDGNIRLGPGANWSVVGSLAPDDDVIVTGRSAVDNWLQMTLGNELRWFAAGLAQVEGDVTTLPLFDRYGKPIPTLTYRTPMQAFRVRSKPGGAECEDLPDGGLVVQAPQNKTVNLRINGLDVSVGSTALIRAGEDETLRLATLAGTVSLGAGRDAMPIEPGMITAISPEGQASIPTRYVYDDVRDLPLTLLPDAVNAPPPDGTPLSTFLCNWDGEFSEKFIPSDRPVIFTEALGSENPERALAIRKDSTVTLLVDGEALPLWGISGQYDLPSSKNAGTGIRTGLSKAYDWWFVLPEPEPGRHTAQLIWEAPDDRYEYTCKFDVQASS